MEPLGEELDVGEGGVRTSPESLSAAAKSLDLGAARLTASHGGRRGRAWLGGGCERANGFPPWVIFPLDFEISMK